MKPARLPSLLALVLIAAACPSHPVLPPTSALPSAEQLLASLAQREGKVRSIRAEPYAAITTPEHSITLKQLLAARAPASLHLETLDFFGRPAAHVATDGTRFALHDAINGHFYVGQASARNLALLLPFPIQPEEIVGVLLGAIPRIPYLTARVEVDASRKAYRITLEEGNGGRIQTLWIGLDDLRPIASTVRGAAAYDLAFSDYQLIGQTIFPMKTELKAVDARGKPTGVSIAIEHGEAIELNPRLGDALFRLEQPTGTRRTELDHAP